MPSKLYFALYFALSRQTIPYHALSYFTIRKPCRALSCPTMAYNTILFLKDDFKRVKLLIYIIS